MKRILNEQGSEGREPGKGRQRGRDVCVYLIFITLLDSTAEAVLERNGFNVRN